MIHYRPPKTIEYETVSKTYPKVSREMTQKERKNYNDCITGRYPSLCKHSWLTPQQAQEVIRAEHREGN